MAGACATTSRADSRQFETIGTARSSRSRLNDIVRIVWISGLCRCVPSGQNPRGSDNVKEVLTNKNDAKMFPLMIYTAVAALGVTSAQAFRPSQALQSDHHRRLYWMGAAASVGLITLFAGAMVL